MDINKLRNIFQRYADGTANETESALVEAWYRSYSPNEQILADDSEARREVVRRNIRAIVVKRSIIRMPLFRIAASITIILTVSLLAWQFLFNRVEYSVVSTGMNGLKEVTLTDGTKVWLNAATRLKVPSKFKGRNREVTLEEGEAFFNVTKDAKHPFIVHTTHVNVQVLGTSFGIKAYKGLHSISVSVATGKVGVMDGQKMLATLTPGQELDFIRATGKFLLKIIDPQQTQSWKSGSTYLHDADFEELALTLKNIYRLQIKAGTQQMAGYRFNLKLMHNLPAQQILELIGQLHQTSFRKEGNDIVLY